MDEQLKQLILNTNFLSPGDKDFLITHLAGMSPLDKLKLKHSLSSGQAPQVLQSLQVMRAKFFEQETKPKQDLLTQVVEKVIKPAPPQIQSNSLINQPQLLGGTVPHSVVVNANNFNTLPEFTSLDQLKFLATRHINFGIEGGGEQVLNNFFSKLEILFEQVEDVNMRRNFFMNFLESSLFTSYIHTGLTALRHLELEPRNIVLNTLYQIDNRYLNNRQFQTAAQICNQIRSLCGL